MLHAELRDAIESGFATDLLASPVLCRDALLVNLRNEVALELRFANPHEYAISWRWGDAQLRIDTAPLHDGLATFPNHLHDGEGRLQADPVTQPGALPWDNVRRVIAALLRDPLLGDASPREPSWTA